MQIDEGLSEIIRRFSAEMADIEEALKAFDHAAAEEQRAGASTEQPQSRNPATEQ